MTQEFQHEEESQQSAAESLQISRLQLLKQKADTMGISYSNNISEATLAERIEQKLASDSEKLNPLDGDVLGEAPAKKLSLRQRLIKDQMALIRVRVTNMDPKKANLPGEILCVANEFLGAVKKFIPYGEATDNGYHIPKCLLSMMEERKFLQVRTIADRRTGTNRVESQWVREYSIERLPQLTQVELHNLAIAQAAAGALENS